jgi:hypothetical protein
MTGGVLDNLLWHVLTKPQSRYASGGPTAGRYASRCGDAVGGGLQADFAAAMGGTPAATTMRSRPCSLAA